MSVLFPHGYHGVFPLRALVDDVVRPLQARLAEQAIETVVDIPSDLMLAADRELMGRAVRNLVLGAMEAMPDGGILTATSAASAQAIELEIADTGAFLSDEERQQVASPEPAPVRGVTGWGLAVVHRIVELHGGNVSAANCPEGGAAFTLRIPRHAALEAAA